jgi:hypothetical protein
LIRTYQVHILQASLIVIAAVEVFLILSFLVLAIWSNRPSLFTNRGVNRLRNISSAWSLPSGKKASALGLTDAQAGEIHQDSVATFLRNRSDALIVGGLGLTAWAVLVTEVSSKVGTAALQLLLIGTAVNLIAPSLIRSGPSEGSYLALSAFVAVGFTAIVFAVLLATVHYFAVGWYSTVVTIVGPIVVITVTLEAILEFGRIKLIFRPPKKNTGGADAEPHTEHRVETNP